MVGVFSLDVGALTLVHDPKPQLINHDDPCGFVKNTAEGFCPTTKDLPRIPGCCARGISIIELVEGTSYMERRLSVQVLVDKCGIVNVVDEAIQLSG